MTASPATLTAELEAAPLTAELPAPALGAVLGGRLHLCGGPPDGPTVHVAIDAGGDLAGGPRQLELPGVVAMAAVGDRLVLVCSGRDPDRAGAGRPLLAALDGGGRLLGTAELALAGPLAQWPRPLDLGGRAWLVWAEGQPSGPASVRACRWEVGERPGPALELAAAGGGVAGLDVAGAGGAGLLAWFAGDGPVHLVGLRDGHAGPEWSARGERAVLARVAPAPDGWWLLWLGREAGPASLQRLDTGLAPVGAPLAVAEAGPGPGASVRDARLLPGDGVTALAWQRATPAPGRPHGERLEELVAADQGLGPAIALAEPSLAYRAAGWLGGRLVLVHGRSGPLVTVLAPA